MFDKLTLKPIRALHIESVRKSTMRLGLDAKRISLREGQALKVGEGLIVFYSYYSGEVYKIQTNPSAFKSYLHFNLMLRELFPVSIIESAKCVRLDLNADYKIPFEDFIKGVDVTRKQIAKPTLAGGKNITHLVIGSGTERIVIYNKASEELCERKPWSRIEVQLTGSKVPIKHFQDLPSYWNKIKNGVAHPFKAVSVDKVSLVEKSSLQTKDEHRRFGMLLASFALIGFAAARRFLNQNGNFKRDFSRLYVSESLEPRPHTQFIQQTESFFSVENKKGTLL